MGSKNENRPELTETEKAEAVKPGEVKARFTKTYIGKLGNFYQGREYVLSADLREKLKADCTEEV